MPRGKLTIKVMHKPSNPTTGQKVTFSARASGDVAKVEILVNACLVKTCPGPECRYVGGPYPERTVTYGANAYDKAGNRAWTGYKRLTVRAAKPAKPPKPARRVRPARPPRPARPSRPAPPPPPTRSSEPGGGSTISGRVTGARDLVDQVKEVSAYNKDQPRQRFVAPVSASGEFRFSNLPDGYYQLSPATGGKFEVASEPRYHDVRCRGGQSHGVNFEITGIESG
jgi:hypothetical protein